jgi:hypothetical protein
MTKENGIEAPLTPVKNRKVQISAKNMKEQEEIQVTRLPHLPFPLAFHDMTCGFPAGARI